MFNGDTAYITQLKQ